MATWKKYFKSANFGGGGGLSPISGMPSTQVGFSNYQSQLPEIYTGHPNRVERYNQYEQMDADSEVNAALDIISEFSVQPNIENGTAFDIVFNESPTDNEIKIIKEQLTQWCNLNEFGKRMFKIFRSTIKYGDQVFVRDPENFKLYWSEMAKVTKVIVNESAGKKPEQYVIKDLNPNLENLTVTAVTTSDSYSSGPQIGGPNGSYVPIVGPGGSSGGSRFSNARNEAVLDAAHVMHLSLTEGLDAFWPFGTSVLESVFKVFKQKELLEDSIIIYRVQRAPERRVFKIDVGNMPSHLAMSFVERVKNEVHQRRIPTQSGGGCFDMHTKVPLLDGREISLYDLATEFDSGKENWCYSCNPVTGKMVPGLITWAGVTKKDVQVIELTLDNGQTITCTPEHKFPILGKGEVEAKDILINEDSLISFNTRLYSINNGKDNKLSDPQYEQVYDHDTKSWVFTHRRVASFITPIRDKTESVIHHCDFNKYNNSPANLKYMTGHSHFALHGEQSRKFRDSLSDQRRDEINAKRNITISNWSAEKKAKRSKVSTETLTKYWKNIKTNPSTYSERYTQIVTNLSEKNKPFRNQSLAWSNRMLQQLVKFTSDETKLAEIVEILNNDEMFIQEYKSLNKKVVGVTTKFSESKITVHSLRKMIKHFGYLSWSDFRKKLPLFNHKVVSIRAVNKKQDVGTLTIDGNEMFHDFHTFAISQGVYTFNSNMMDATYNPLSINEDYFFPQTAEGRGSSVEILPGGQNLGEITDLRFFTNKLFRGLRIPSSYLPTQPDEAANNFSDGKVGIAMIQEWRFNQYCKKLQSLISDPLDREFKLFLRFRGINIDNGVFTLRFNEPQNFTKYRQAEVDSARIATFSQLEAFPYFSKRFLMTRYLDLSEEEMQENEKLWAEEHADTAASSETDPNLRSVGVSSGSLGSDLENTAMPDDVELGDEGGAPDVAGGAGAPQDVNASAPPAPGM